MVVVAPRKRSPPSASHPTLEPIIMDQDRHQNSVPRRSVQDQNHLQDPVDRVAPPRPPINLQNTCGTVSGLPMASRSDHWLLTVYPLTTPLLSRHLSHPLFQRQRHCHADLRRREWIQPLLQTGPHLQSGYLRVARPPSSASLAANSNNRRSHLRSILATILRGQPSYAHRSVRKFQRAHDPV